MGIKAEEERKAEEKYFDTFQETVGGVRVACSSLPTSTRLIV